MQSYSSLNFPLNIYLGKHLPIYLLEYMKTNFENIE